MSKSNSGYFKGTSGYLIKQVLQRTDTAIIKERGTGLDLREHPLNVKQLSRKQRKIISEKLNNRTAKKEEYKIYIQNKRFENRRLDGVRNFCFQETLRLSTGLPGTRNWTPEQFDAILNGERPKFKGKTIQGHHTYSAKKYPHLADKGEIIYPVTFKEHLYGWHGGNFQNSKAGRPIKLLKEF